MKIPYLLEMSFQSKLPIWNSHWFEFHFTSINMNTSKELTEHQSEIFNQNEISYHTISYRFEFILPLTWTYSFEKTKHFELWNHTSVLLVFLLRKIMYMFNRYAFKFKIISLLWKCFLTQNKIFAFRDLIKYFESAPPELGRSDDGKWTIF